MTTPFTGQSIPTIPVPNVELFEGDSGVTEGYNQNGPWAIKKYLVNWNDRFLFAQAMGGSTKHSGSGGAGGWIRVIPYPYPANPIMYAKELTIEPRGQWITPSVPIAWQYAVVTVSFGALSWDAFPAIDDPFGFATIGGAPQDSIPFASQRVSFGYETIEIPRQSLTYLSDGMRVTSSLGMRVPVTTLSITFEKFPLIPMAIVANYIGKVNSAPFLARDVGTVFFDGLEVDRQQSFSTPSPGEGYEANTTQRVAVVFRWRRIPWNRFMRPDKLVFEGISDNLGNTVYEGADFNDMVDALTT